MVFRFLGRRPNTPGLLRGDSEPLRGFTLPMLHPEHFRRYPYSIKPQLAWGYFIFIEIADHLISVSPPKTCTSQKAASWAAFRMNYNVENSRS